MTDPTRVTFEEEEPPKEAVTPPNFAIMQNLFKTRTVLIFGEITQKLAESVTAQLLAMAAESDDDIKIVMNSQGGHVEAGDTIHDMIRFIKPRVKVLGSGWVASAGAIIFLGAPREDRYCLPNTRFLLHQPMGGMGGQASDIAIEARQIIQVRRRLNEIIARETGQPLEKVERDTERNFWMASEDAKAYGLVTHIISDSSQFE